MRSAVWHGGEDFRVEEAPDPQLKPEEIRIEVAVAAVCGTDVHAQISDDRVPLEPLNGFIEKSHIAGSLLKVPRRAQPDYGSRSQKHSCNDKKSYHEPG